MFDFDPTTCNKPCWLLLLIDIGQIANGASASGENMGNTCVLQLRYRIQLLKNTSVFDSEDRYNLPS